MTSARGGLGCAFAAAVALVAAPAMAADFPVAPETKAVGQIQTYVVQQGDNFADIARKFDIGYTEMVAANPGVQPWTPPVGKTLYIPSLYILPNVPRQGIVIDLGERRLYYFPRDGGAMQTYPIGIGAIGFDTPHTTTTVVRKEPNPVWIPPPSIRAEQPDLPTQIGPGPDDPLGDFALRLGWPNYLIHGTNKPDGVGRNVSHGCIHLYPEDIQKLFNSVAVRTPVRVIDQPAAATWLQDGLYVEVHPSKDQADQIDTETPMSPDLPADLRQIVSAAAGNYAQAVDWNAVDQAGLQRTGLPIEVAQGAPSGPMGGVPVASNPAASQNAYVAPAAAPDAGPAAEQSSLTPIFNTLQPPPGMAPALPSAPADAGAPQPPQDLIGNAYTPPAPVYAAPPVAPADQDVNDLQDLRNAPQSPPTTDEAAQVPPSPGSIYNAAPANAPSVDPNAAYNAQYKSQTGQ
jgi:L,D-transpeptidase ErfK/SrfK